MAVAEPIKEGKLNRQECWRIVNEVYDEAVKLACRSVFDHPFTRELKAGTLPLECIRGWILNSYAWALEINMSLPEKYYLFSDALCQKTDLLELLADKYADEFATPGRGGHQRTLDTLGQAVGLGCAEMQEYKLLPAMRAMLDSTVWNFEVSHELGIGNVLEEWFGHWCALWFESLTKHYGLSDEGAFYFRLHSEADSRDSHAGGEAIGHEVMGHAQGNRYMTVRALEDGRVKPDHLRQAVMGAASVDSYLNFLDAVYYTYHPSKRLSDVELTRR